MRPYYEESGITIFHDDMRAMQSAESFDACITDPPYGETSLAWDRRVSGWTQIVPSNVLWCFGSLRMFMAMTAASEFDGWAMAQEIVWEKHNGSNFHTDRFRRVHELAVQFYRGDWASVYKNVQTTPDATARAIRRKERPAHTGEIAGSTYLSIDGGPRLMRSVIRARSCHGYAQHPTQKPLEVLKPLIEYSVPSGGSVLDPFMGSGSTLVAAKELGRSAVGIDIDERNCEIAAKRLGQGVIDFGPDPGVAA